MTRAKKNTAATGTAVAVTEPTAKPSLLTTFGQRYNIEPSKVLVTLQKTAFPDAKSAEEFMSLLVVANEYGLNPFIRQIYAFSQNGKVVPVVSIDGWLHVINNHPQFDGMEFRYSDKRIKIGNSKPCPEWVEVTIYRKDRAHPTTVREEFDECYRNTAPWNTTPKRMLRHRAIIQAGRVAFGLSFVDPEDVARIASYDDPVVAAPAESKNAARIIAAAEAAQESSDASNAPETASVDDYEAEDAVVVDDETGEVTDDTGDDPDDDQDILL